MAKSFIDAVQDSPRTELGIPVKTMEYVEDFYTSSYVNSFMKRDQ